MDADTALKTDYLSVYDYGTGGGWILIRARSKQEISQRFPELTVVEHRPAWMTDEVFESIRSKVVDIDGEIPSWLKPLP